MRLCSRYGREEATLRKSVCFDELRGKMRRCAADSVSIKERGERLSIEDENEGGRGENNEVMA
jgi:hypothetical protein